MQPLSYVRSRSAVILCLTLIILLVLSGTVASATVNVRPQATTSPAIKFITTTPTSSPTPQTVTCTAPCECLLTSEAVTKWGESGFTQCAELPCGYSYTIAGAPLEKHCFQQKPVTAATKAPVVTSGITMQTITAAQTYYQVQTTGTATYTTQPIVLQTPSLAMTGSDNVGLHDVVLADSDNDGLPDINDNCPHSANPEQYDYDNDGAGDDCDSCMIAKNPDQKDTDGDLIGDACDLCPLSKEPDIQGNTDDMDAPGAEDSDNDRIGNRCDNCPTIANPDQKDSNNDGIGDACAADLSVMVAEPVQVISAYGTPLVRDKGTAFTVKVRSTANYPIMTKFRLVLPQDQWDMVRGNALNKNQIPASYEFPEVWGPVEIPAHADNYRVILPVIPETERDKKIDLSNGDFAGRMIVNSLSPAYGIVIPDVRVMPKPIRNPASFSVVIDPENTVIETNENNNRWDSGSYTVVTTREQSFGIQRVRVINKNWDSSLDNNAAANPEHCTADCGPGGKTEARTAVKNNLEYFLGTFPVADDKIYGVYLPGDEVWDTNDPNFDTRSEFLIHLYSKVAGTYDWVVGETCGCCGATISWTTKAVLIGNSTTNIHNLAHEASHVSGVGNAADCYGCGDNGVKCSDCRSSPGFWVNRWQEYPLPTPPAGGDQAKWDSGESDWLKRCYFMDFSNYAPYCWARKDAVGKTGGGNWGDGYVNTLNRLADPGDPVGLYASGVLYSNGTITLAPFSVMEDVRLDVAPGSQGDLNFVLKGSDGKVLGRTGIPVSFSEMAMPPATGTVLLDSTAFANIIDWKEGTRSIEVQDGTGKILAVRTVSLSPPSVSVISPAGGEVWKAGTPATVRWQAADPDDDPLTYAVQVSADAGKTWIPMAAGLTGSEYTFDTTGLPPAQQAVVKVRVSDGVNTAESISARPFTILSDETKPAGAGYGSEVVFLCIASVAGAYLIILRERR